MTPPSIGLDLGRVRDLTAMVLVEPWRDRLALTKIDRWKPERSDCADALLRVIDLAVELDARPRLAIDVQGGGPQMIGRKVARVAVTGPTRDVCDVYPIHPSGSPRPDRQLPDGRIYITKNRAVETLFGAMNHGRLVLAQHLTHGDLFREEMLRLSRVETRGGMGWTYSHPDQAAGSHDDLVMATVYALWAAEQGGRYRPVREARW